MSKEFRADNIVFENTESAGEFVKEHLEEYDEFKEKSKQTIIKAMAIYKGWEKE